MENRMEEQYSKPVSVYYSGREKCAPNHFFGPAIRAHYLMHVVLKGKGVYEVRGKTYQLETGNVFLICPKEVTLYKADEWEPWEYAWIAFDGYEVKKILNQTVFQDNQLVCLPKQHKSVMEEICKLSELFESSQYNEFELTGLFYRLMGLMIERKGDSRESYEKQYYQKAFDYIRHNYGYPIKITDIAKHVGIDRTYLYKIFMEMEGSSPKQFLIQFRVQAAKNMLGTKKYSVTETAYSCGFKDAAAFCNHFKNITGMTPKQYQHSMEESKAFHPGGGGAVKPVIH